MLPFTKKGQFCYIIQGKVYIRSIYDCLIGFTTEMANRKARVFNTFLTGVDRKEQLEKLKEKVDWFIGQDELGAGGMEHIQLMFGFKNPRSLANTIQNLQDENIQITEDSKTMLKYCTNEEKRHGELYSFGDIPNFRKNSVQSSTIDEALKLNSYEEAMKFIEDTDKIYFISNQKRLSLYFSQKFDTADKALYKPEDFNIPLVENLSKVLVFIGKTGLGKTQYALAHFKNPLHIRDKEDWRRYNTSVDGIILDDLDFPKWSPLTFLKLLDLENPITQNVKYGSVRISAGIPRIICVNDEELLWPTNIHAETRAACNRRMKIYFFDQKLYGGQKRKWEEDLPVLDFNITDFINNFNTNDD